MPEGVKQLISASFYKRNGKHAGFHIKGHSGYSEAGSDIVCSAVSAIAQTTLLGLIEIVKPEMDYKIDQEGEIDCIIHKETNEGALMRAELLIDTMRLGLESIKQNYGKYLSISEREVT